MGLTILRVIGKFLVFKCIFAMVMAMHLLEHLISINIALYINKRYIAHC